MRRTFLRAVFAIAIASLALPALAFTAAAQEAPKILGARPVQVLWDQADRYVAGKATVVVAVLDAAITPDAAAHKAIVKLGGATVASLAPLPSTEPTRVLEFACSSMSECGGWKAGAYTLEVSVGAATSTTTHTFKDRKPQDFVAMALKQNYGPGDVRTLADEGWKKLFDFSRRTFPLAPDQLRVAFAPELDLSADKFNIQTTSGMDEVANGLNALMPADCSLSPVPANVTCYTKIVGFVRDHPGPPGQKLAGYKQGKANVNTATDEDAPVTVAHEIAHGFELGDEYEGGQYHCKNNPTPPSYVGKDFEGNSPPPYSCKSSARKPFPFGGTASLVEPIFDGAAFLPANEGPYEIGGRRFLTPMASLMGSGTKLNQAWISRDIWVRLFDGFDPAATASAVAPQVAPTRYVSFAGQIDSKDTVQLDPWSSFSSTRAPANTTGPLAIRAVNATGTVLATSAVTVDPAPPEGIPWDFNEFRGSVAYPSDTARFEIVRGTRVLAAKAVTANAPVVTITSPRAGDRPTGEAAISWTATDADGGQLTTLVEYSADNGRTWLPFEGDIEGTSVTIDWSEVGGTGRAESLVRVTVSDGVNATSATSGAFTVTAKPPFPDILFPGPYSETARGAPVFLYGEGLDLLDDIIVSADGITWTSDRDGLIGKGDLVETTKLSQGVHTITMTVKNSIGLTATSTVTVVVHPAGRKVTAADVYSVYSLYLGRVPQYPQEVVGWLGKDFSFLVDEVRESLEAMLWIDAGKAVEPKSPYTGLRIR